MASHDDFTLGFGTRAIHAGQAPDPTTGAVMTPIMTHASVPLESRNKLGIVDGFIRLSVGIEDLSDLQGDLDRAFHAAN